MGSRFLLPVCLAAALTGGIAVAQVRSTASEAEAMLLLAKRQAEEATLRSQALERRAAEASNDAAKARAAAAAVAARIQAAEADITAAETRIRIIEAMRAEQRARLAEKQEPVVRLTAALQTMARRPAALALVQPGSIDDVVHVRSLLASTLPIIRARTASLRQELSAANALRRQAQAARLALRTTQEELRSQRLAFARLEERQRQRSEELAGFALTESDRALALGERASDLAAQMRTREYQDRLRARLSQLPGPTPRPDTRIAETAGAATGRPPYILPLDGRLVTGMGEISEAGVHARGLTFEAAAETEIVAPRAGRIAYAGPFAGYGQIVIIDHGGGWTSLVTNLAQLAIEAGEPVAMGAPLGQTISGDSRVTVELRRNGRPFSIPALIARG